MISIPYQPDLLLGLSVDMKRMEVGDMIIKEDTKPFKLKHNLNTCQFSFINNLKDVCSVLSIPPEYALKVKSEIIKNEMVTGCLKYLGRKDYITVIIRATLLQQEECLPSDIVPSLPEPNIVPSLPEPTNDQSVESLISNPPDNSDASMHDGNAVQSVTSQEKTHPIKATHWVKAVEIGDELITVMNIGCKDINKRNKMENKLLKRLQSCKGELTSAKLEAFHKVAVIFDKELDLKSNEYALDIKYCSFTNLEKYPASITGMVKTIENFVNQCEGWADISSSQETECKVEASIMKCYDGIDNEEKQSFTDKFLKKVSKLYHGSGESATSEAACSTLQDTDDELKSFEVIDTSARSFYNLRVTLQSFQKETNTDVADSSSKLDLKQHQEATYTILKKLLNLFVDCKEAIFKFNDFLSKHNLVESDIEEANKILKSPQTVYMDVLKTITELDFMSMPSESTVENLSTENFLSAVNLFIENIMYRLPPGIDVDLLMFGKTGHGKSSTGNSILRWNAFKVSSGYDSETTNSGLGWSDVDGRIIKVVDTQGIYDTHQNCEADYIKSAIKSMSQAIAYCPEGFHALLLIIPFGVRMTQEEKNAIDLLKRVLGENIIKDHCICIITRGDQLEKELAEEKITFENWCKKSFLKDLFTECNYRCVVYNNKTTDPKVKKMQLIELINKVDSLQKTGGTRYTNSLFQYVQNEYRKIMAQEQMNHEEIMRDIQLIRERVKNLNNIKAEKEYKNELSKLKEKVDNLKSKSAGKENEEFSILVEIVDAAITSKMLEMAKKPNADVPAASQNTATNVKVSDAASTINNQAINKATDNLQKHCDNKIVPKHNDNANKVAEDLEPEVKKSGCFPGSSLVTLANGRSITFDELCIGDKVLVRGEAGHLIHDTVYMFGHQEPEAFTEFIVMSTASHTVHVTAGHYVYCVKQGQEVCVAAKNVNVGDCLLVATDDGLMHQPVKTITYQRKKGLFAPFTYSGTIVVDGGLMSCYVDVLPPSACHALLWPIRLMNRLSPRAVGYINGSSQQYPVPRWAVAIMKFL